MSEKEIGEKPKQDGFIKVKKRIFYKLTECLNRMMNTTEFVY